MKYFPIILTLFSTSFTTIMLIYAIYKGEPIGIIAATVLFLAALMVAIREIKIQK